MGGVERDVLELLYGWTRGTDEKIEIAVRKNPKWVPLFTTLDDLLTEGVAGGTLAARSADGWDVYIGACTLSAEPERGRGGSGLRARSGAVWVDLDCVAPGREGEKYFADRAEALALLAAVEAESGLSPAVLVDSGWGIQAWYPLAEPVSAREASRLTRGLVSRLREIAADKQIDRIWDMTRVLRFPGAGTLNWRGGPGWETESRILHFDPENTIPVAAFPYAPVEEESAGAADAGVASGALGGGSGALMDLESIFDRVPWSVVLEPFGWTRALGWDGEPEGGGDNREAEVWVRPGKDRASGERSAVVYADAPGVLVVHSDAPECGLPGWWETRSAGGRGEGGREPANTRWNVWWRLVSLNGTGGLGGAAREDVARVALAVTRETAAEGTTVEAARSWPEPLIRALHEDGSIVRSWLDRRAAARLDQVTRWQAGAR